MDQVDLLETPLAMTGDLDWDEAKLHVTDIGFAKQWNVVGRLALPVGVLDIAQCGNSWMLGAMHPRADDQSRQEFRALLLAEGELPNRSLPYREPLIIRFVYIINGRRALGLATHLYSWLANNGRTLIGDGEQYVGARRLWSRLSRTPGYAVDLLNISTGQVLKSGIMLHQGVDDDDYDREVWSPDERLLNVRPVLRLV